jgi:plasmid maintenance system antidote protein VapI
MDKIDFKKIIENKDITPELADKLVELFEISNDQGKQYLFDKVQEL